MTTSLATAKANYYAQCKGTITKTLIHVTEDPPNAPFCTSLPWDPKSNATADLGTAWAGCTVFGSTEKFVHRSTTQDSRHTPHGLAFGALELSPCNTPHRSQPRHSICAGVPRGHGHPRRGSMQAADAMVDTATIDRLCAAQRGRIVAAAEEQRQPSPNLPSTPSVGSRRLSPTRASMDSSASSASDVTDDGAELTVLEPEPRQKIPRLLRALLCCGRPGAPASCLLIRNPGLSRGGCLNRRCIGRSSQPGVSCTHAALCKCMHVRVAWREQRRPGIATECTAWKR